MNHSPWNFQIATIYLAPEMLTEVFPDSESNVDVCIHAFVQFHFLANFGLFAT